MRLRCGCAGRSGRVRGQRYADPEPGQVFIPDVGPPVPSTPPLVQSPLFEPAPSSTAVAAGPAESTTGSATTAVPGPQPAPRTETVASSTGSSGTAPSAAEAAATENPDTPSPLPRRMGAAPRTGSRPSFRRRSRPKISRCWACLPTCSAMARCPPKSSKRKLRRRQQTLARQRTRREPRAAGGAVHDAADFAAGRPARPAVARHRREDAVSESGCAQSCRSASGAGHRAPARR